MGRPPRVTEPGLVYHLLNRRVMRLPLFQKDGDYRAFERVLADALQRSDAPNLMAWCLMPNHWHLVVHAGRRTNLSTWMQWLTVTHTHRWHAHTDTTGQGPLYQGRFKSFPVQDDGHFLTVCRYVEANARRAKLVKRSEAWPWCSLSARRDRASALHGCGEPWPVDRPRNWLTQVNRPIDADTLRSVQQSIARGVPLGAAAWTTRIANRLDLNATLRPRGRPRKNEQKQS